MEEFIDVGDIDPLKEMVVYLVLSNEMRARYCYPLAALTATNCNDIPKANTAFYR